MPDSFYNPYHFVPATGQVTDADGNSNGVATEPFESIRDGNSPHPARHDRWNADAYTGRMVCRLTLERPTLVGGEQADDPDDPDDPKHKHRPKTVTPYQRRIKGKNGKTERWPAIPGSSLRGLIAGMAEALSQSALRVLDNTPYSFRYKLGKDDEHALSALGYLVPAPAGKDRKYDLVPVALPTLDRGITKAPEGTFVVPATWQVAFRGHRWIDALPAYIDGYESSGAGPDGVRLQSDTFLDRHQPASGSCAPGAAHWWYARIPSTRLDKPLTEGLSDSLEAFGNPLLYCKSTYDQRRNQEWDRWLLGLRLPRDHNAIIDAEHYHSLEDNHKALYVRGILRVLGIEERADEIPNTKKHELFIPMPEDKPETRIPVPDEVIDTFESIAGMRWQASKGEHPFHLQGRPRETAVKATPHELYFFDLKSGEAVVSELSVSAVWRRAVGDRSQQRQDRPHDFFAQVNRHLPPLTGNPNDPDAPAQRALTPAELLFGVVAENKHADQVNAAALASRVRVHDALTLRKPKMAQTSIILKTLSSPKAPSPALYFTPHPRPNASGPEQASAIAKAKLNKVDHRPQGRKVYLHHPLSGFNAADPSQWTCASHEQQHDHLRRRCQPLQPEPDNPFWFHIDFDNLDRAELTLLLAALRPDDRFRHKLGLGKPLGLGTVHIEPVALCLTDRQKRYGRHALEQPRYHKIQRTAAADPAVIEQRWPREAAAMQAGAEQMAALDWASLPDMDPRLIDRSALQVLCKLGDPAQVASEHQVTTPLTREQLQGALAQPEQETFKWFVANDDQPMEMRQALIPVDPDNPLPLLRAHPHPD